MSMDWSRIAAFRLRRHHLLGPSVSDLVTVCRNVCGMQAQVMSAAELQFRARIPDITRAQIRTELWANRTLVKSSFMRQTLHVIPAADFSIYIAALRKSRSQALARIMSKYGDITQRETESLNQLILDALESGPMTQPELKEAILPRAGRKVRNYMEYAWNIQLFRPALVQGLICYGPEAGKKVTFVRVDQWLPKQEKVSERDAKRILLRHYLAAYGPATLQDFSKWSGISTKEARPVWESMQPEMIEVAVGDQKAYIHQQDHDELIEAELTSPVVRLLPYFDPYLLGHVNTEQMLSAVDYKKVYRNQGWISPVVLLDGKIIGTWSHRSKGKRTVVEIATFDNNSKPARTHIEQQADNLGRFLETPVDLRFDS